VSCEATGVTIARTVVLVEGLSDQVAIQSLAARQGRNFAAERIAIVPMGGATNIRRYLQRLCAQESNVKLAGLYDAGEEKGIRRGLEWVGLGADLSRTDMEALGFYVCVADLEDELIRALGAQSVEHIIDAHGELGSFRTMQRQPAQQARTIEAQLRRFMGTKGGRKVRYARLLVEALDLARVPRPLDRLLRHI
jgi:hypothetical protein